MASSSSSSVPRIGSMTPTQFGEIAKPSRLDLIRLDMEKQGVVPDDNIYAQLLGSLTRGREWNLPETQEHLLHTVAYPYPGKRRDIIGTNYAYWQVQDPSPLAGRMGEKIGTQTFMKLMFKKKGEPETTGNWRAIEYKSLANDERSAIVVLTCTDEVLVDLEKQVKQHELRLLDLHQQRLQHELEGEESKAQSCHERITRVVRQLSGMKEYLEEEKEEARAAEEDKAGVVHIIPIPIRLPNEFEFKLLS